MCCVCVYLSHTQPQRQKCNDPLLCTVPDAEYPTHWLSRCLSPSKTSHRWHYNPLIEIESKVTQEDWKEWDLCTNVAPTQKYLQTLKLHWCRIIINSYVLDWYHIHLAVNCYSIHNWRFQDDTLNSCAILSCNAPLKAVSMYFLKRELYDKKWSNTVLWHLTTAQTFSLYGPVICLYQFCTLSPDPLIWKISHNNKAICTE